jgi:hypothetical protein
MLRDIRDFMTALWKDWLAGMSGIFSVILMLAQAAYPDISSKWVWIAAGACLVFALFRLWLAEHHKNNKLLGLMADDEALRRMGRALQFVEGFTQSEREAVCFILTSGLQADAGVEMQLQRLKLPKADLVRLAKIGVIVHIAGGAWDIHPDYVQPLRVATCAEATP